MSRVGLDTEWGNKSSADLVTLGGRLSEVLKEVGQIRHEAAGKWFGPDFNALAGWYDGPGKRYLDRAIKQIFDASNNLKGNTRDQEQKSTASKGSVVR